MVTDEVNTKEAELDKNRERLEDLKQQRDAAHAVLVETDRIAWLAVDKIKVKETALMQEVNAGEEVLDRLANKLGLIEEERDRARQLEEQSKLPMEVIPMIET